MDAASLLALPSSPAPSGLQTFAIFVNFFFPALALVVVSVRVAGRVVASQFALDDWLVCVAMFLSIGETVISFFCKPAVSLHADPYSTANTAQLSRQTMSASPLTRCLLMTLHRG